MTTSDAHPQHPTKLVHEEDVYFATNPAPKFLPRYREIAQAFFEKHAQAGRRVVLVTSGGTTVPLENQTVRFIDNFSAGTRGATSAEYFLNEGYAVLFLHRRFSLLPYSRHYSHSTNCFLDFMMEETDVYSAGRETRVVVGEEWQEKMLDVLRRYRTAKREGTLCMLEYESVTEYLWSLRAFATLMGPLGPRALFYLAAAVSDFFVPPARMAEHKLQSGEEFRGAGGDGEAPAARMQDQKLVIDLDPVPKFLQRLVDGWAPQGMIVSFKLETDPSILTRKAEHALHKYAHHLVIGNLLHTRKYEVVFVSAHDRAEWVRVPRGADGEPVTEIESRIIPKVAALHDTFILGQSAR